MMDNKDLDVEKALDELFGGDFVDKEENLIEDDNLTSSKEENDILFIDFEPINSNYIVINEDDTSHIENKISEDTVIFQQLVPTEESNSVIDEAIYELNYIDNVVDKINLEQTIIPETLKTINEVSDYENNINELKNIDETIFPYEKVKNEEYIEKKKNSPEVLKIILIITIILISVFCVVGLIVKITTPGILICNYNAEVEDFVLRDKYEINYKSNKILSVIGEYKYRDKTDNYNEQIQFIKDEKLPVIINSNGIPGFTYIYEIEEEIIKVYSYLDFTLFNYDEIDKINQKSTPISYFDISKNMKPNQLRKVLEKKGYTCK